MLGQKSVDLLNALRSKLGAHEDTVVALLLGLGTVLFYVIQSLLTKRSKKQYSYIVPDSRDGDKGEIHRAPECPDGPLSLLPGAPHIKTLYDNFQHGLKINPNGPLYGYRPLDGKGQAGDYQWYTYSEVNTMAKNFGAGLMKENLVPTTDGMRMLAMFSKNRWEWTVAEQGLYMYSGTTVPIYDTLGADIVEYIVNQTQLSTVLCSRAVTSKVLECKAACKTLKAIIQMEDPTPEDKEAAKGVKLYGFKELQDIGKANPSAPVPPKPESVATFCYTSGTTDKPKGALLTHANMVATLAGACARGVVVGKEDRHLSYLPLAHVFERVVQNGMVYGGGAVGFYQGDVTKITSDLVALRPTLFCSVPRLLTKVYDKILAGANASPIKSFLMKTGIAVKTGRMYWSGTQKHWFWDRLVFNKVAKKVGLDRCKMIVTGSAPISANVMQFLRVVFGAKVIEGYGQSETSTSGTLTSPSDITCGHVGGPQPSNEVRLVSVTDMAYLVTDTTHSGGDGPDIPCRGRGEICIRGAGVFPGYYKLPDKTSETLDKDGWCLTGDVGIWLMDGQLKIVDRKKNMFKLSQGEYVAAEKIENIYATCSLVAQSFVYGDSLKSCLVAVVVPDFDELKKWAAQNNKAQNEAGLCADAAVKKAILDQMTTTGRAAKLKGFELAKDIHLEPEAFSVENGLFTPTFKLKRHEAKLKYKKQIDAMYSTLKD